MIKVIEILNMRPSQGIKKYNKQLANSFSNLIRFKFKVKIESHCISNFPYIICHLYNNSFQYDMTSQPSMEYIYD